MSAIPLGASVVVVEDNPDSREMLCSMLTHAGLSCHGADDGIAGLRLVEEIAPSIVILDVGLPGIDGLEVARRIRANPRRRGVRLIALTGYGQTSDREATRAAGFDYHLVKPVQPGDLLALLAQLQMSLERAPADADTVLSSISDLTAEAGAIQAQPDTNSKL